MPIKDFIDKIEEIPLDGNDLLIMSEKLGNSGTKWMIYDDLGARLPDGSLQISDIAQLFSSGNNTMYILLQIKSSGGGDSIGHWISLIDYRGDERRSFDYGHYDSYGLTIDGELDFTHASPYLTKLLTGTRLEENRVQHQKFGGRQQEVNTCGRMTVARSIFYYLSNSEYDKMIIQPIIRHNDVRDADVFVSLLTAFLPPNDDPIRNFFMSKVGIDSNTFRGTPF